MTDYYATLGVPRTATASDIKQAFRRLASQHHPDKGGDTQKFQEIQAAYAVLGDGQKRAEYDNPRAQIHPPGGANFNFDDIFSMFGARFHPEHQQRQHVARLNIWITMYDVAQGGPRTISMSSPHGQSVAEINVPPGIEDGDAVRYARVGPMNSDIVVTFRIKPDTEWLRNGADLTKEIAVSIWDLVLGTKLQATTILNETIEVTVPANTQPGTMLRLRNYGLPVKSLPRRGDMLLKVQSTLPKIISPELLELIRNERANK